MTRPHDHVVPTADAMRALGEKVGSILTAGDVVLLVGGLGAGKTTFTQGIGRGLNVQGKITSPTYIVARVHDALADGPDLVHVDAYRLEDELDLETVDLDASAEDSVTVVEWGRDRAEGLSDQRLEIEFTMAAPDPSGAGQDVIFGDDGVDVVEPETSRLVRFIPVGKKWQQRLWEAGLQ